MRPDRTCLSELPMNGSVRLTAGLNEARTGCVDFWPSLYCSRIRQALPCVRSFTSGVITNFNIRRAPSLATRMAVATARPSAVSIPAQHGTSRRRAIPIAGPVPPIGGMPASQSVRAEHLKVGASIELLHFPKRKHPEGLRVVSASQNSGSSRHMGSLHNRVRLRGGQ